MVACFNYFFFQISLTYPFTTILLLCNPCRILKKNSINVFSFHRNWIANNPQCFCPKDLSLLCDIHSLIKMNACIPSHFSSQFTSDCWLPLDVLMNNCLRNTHTARANVWIRLIEQLSQNKNGKANFDFTWLYYYAQFA